MNKVVNGAALHQLILALASLAAISYLGVEGTLSGDAVAGMVGAIVAYVTGRQAGTVARAIDSATTTTTTTPPATTVTVEPKGPPA